MPRVTPLKPIHLHVLLVLASGPRHGYGIVKDIEAATNGGIRLEPGNLYRYVGQLERAGLVAPAERKPLTDESGDERRRYYRITPSGREAINAEIERMKSLVARAEAHLASSGAEPAS